MAVMLGSLAQGLATAPRALERFQREARGLARLAHPGIVRIHDTGIFQGSPYLVMDLVEGPTLAELELPLTPERAARIVRALALAVDAAGNAYVTGYRVAPRDAKVVAAVARSARQSCSLLAAAHRCCLAWFRERSRCHERNICRQTCPVPPARILW